MADNVSIKDASNNTVTVAADEVTDGTLGTVEVQYLKIMDGTINGTNKAAVSASGELSTKVVSALPAGTNLMGKVGIDQTTPGTTNAVSLSQIGATTASTGNGTVDTGTLRVAIASNNTAFSVNATAAGDVAHDSVDSGNPVKIGGKALTANPTAVATGDRVQATFDTVGRIVPTNTHVRALVGHQTTTITSSTAETTFVSAIASTFCDLSTLSITNKSASSTVVTIRDATAGTTRMVHNIPAGGGMVLSFPTPIPQTTVNNNWTIQCTTSVDSLYVHAVYLKNV